MFMYRLGVVVVVEVLGFGDTNNPQILFYACIAPPPHIPYITC